MLDNRLLGNAKTMTHAPEAPIKKYIKMSGGDLSDYWLDAYGWVSCYFAQLEGLGYALIDLLSNSEEKPRLKRLPFQKRTEEARVLVCARLRALGEVDLADEWDALLREAKDAAPKRNDILHNPLSVNLALGDPLHDQDAGIVLVHEPGEPKPVLKLGAVQAFADSMLDLNTRMQDLLKRSQLIHEQDSCE